MNHPGIVTEYCFKCGKPTAHRIRWGQKAVCLECGPRIRAMLRCNPVRMFHREDGFTLIELLIVLAILGLIVGVVAMAGALPIGG